MMQSAANLLIVNSKLCAIEIASNKTRSFLTSFGIFLGVASLLAMLSFARGFRSTTSKALERMGGVNIFTVRAASAESPEETIDFSRSPGLRMEQFNRAMKQIPGIEKVYPIGNGPSGFLRTPKGHGRAHMRAVGPGHMEEYNYSVQSGRMLSDEDHKNRDRVGVIGSQVAQRLFRNPDAALNQKVQVNHVIFRIVGIIAAKQRHDWRNSQFLYPYSVYENEFAGHGGQISEIDVKVRDVKTVEDTKKQLERFLLTEHRGVNDFEAELNSEKLEDQRKANWVMSILLGSIASISLIVGGICIANIMFASIGERIREIGIRKSLGARKKDLFLQFLSEAVSLSCLGGLLGMALGSIPTFLPADIFPFEPQLIWFDYLLAVGATVFVGIVSGLFPALFAAKMNPVDALHYA